MDALRFEPDIAYRFVPDDRVNVFHASHFPVHNTCVGSIVELGGECDRLVCNSIPLI